MPQKSHEPVRRRSVGRARAICRGRMAQNEPSALAAGSPWTSVLATHAVVEYSLSKNDFDASTVGLIVAEPSFQLAGQTSPFFSKY